MLILAVTLAGASLIAHMAQLHHHIKLVNSSYFQIAQCTEALRRSALVIKAVSSGTCEHAAWCRGAGCHFQSQLLRFA